MKAMIFAATALLALAEAIPEVGSSRPMQHNKRGVQRPAEMPRLGAQTSQGCFKSSGNLKLINATVKYNSIGGCAEKICLPLKYPVGATMGGSQCFCGDEYPPKADLVDDSNCNYDCTGYDQEACGGINFWSVYNTGVALVVDYAEVSSSSTKSTAAPTSAASTSAAEVTVTATQSPSNDSGNSGGGTNVAGVAAGVVVGILVIAGAVGGVFLYMRRKRNREIEEEHRRNAAVNDFFSKPPGSSAGSMTDTRLDPVLVNRRLSDGSIADNQDYSRRILRVTNA